MMLVHKALIMAFSALRYGGLIHGRAETSSCEEDTSSNNMDNVSSIESSDKSEVIEIEIEMREKLNKLKKDFTKEQVHEIMGEPDEVPLTGLYWEYYFVDETKKVVIGYFSDGITIELVDTVENKNEKIL